MRLGQYSRMCLLASRRLCFERENIMTTYKCRYCDAISTDENISPADGVCLQHPAGVGNHTFRHVGDNRICSFISSVRELSKKWKSLTAAQKRAVLDAIGDDVDTATILEAMKKVRKTK